MIGYQGNPNNDPITIQVLTDSDLWTAANVDAPIEALADSIAYLRARANASSSNWPDGVLSFTSIQIGGGTYVLQSTPVWDSAYARWIGAFVDTSNQLHFLASADGNTWTDIGWSITNSGAASDWSCFGLLTGSPSPSSGTIVALCDAAAGTFAGNYNERYLPGTSPGGLASAITPPGGNNWVSGGYMIAPSVWVAWSGGVSGVPPVYSTDAYAHPWVNAATWAPPAGFVIHNRAHFIATFAGQQAIYLFPSGSSVAADYMVSLDGQNWFTAMPTLPPGTSVVDAAFDSFTGTVYLLTNNGGTITHLWSSTVAGTWTLVTTFNHVGYALRANGRELLVWLGLPGVGVAQGTLYVGVQSTNGGASWGITPIRSSSAPSGTFALRANGNQFLYCNPNANEYASSSFVGAPQALTV